MDAVYYITGFLLLVLLPGIPVATIIYLINPKLTTKLKFIKHQASRRRIAAIGIASFFIAFVGLGSVVSVTEPVSVRQARVAADEAEQKAEAAKLKQQRLAEQARIEAAKPKLKTESKTESIDYKTVKKHDSSLAKGKTKVSTKGRDGQRTITYHVTYVNGEETKREEIKNRVTKKPVAKVVLVGTYVAPKPAPAPSHSSSSSSSSSHSSHSGSGYRNSAGNYVPSPSSNPAGATAKCADGTYSYSQSRRGTCSHHGGVIAWL